ncbi:serpin family protein [Endozoicomonas acroporae]|uniref:serpin family protein n=1 Tax=Endozoicomonas acroporae TaxID=1701104 RepID=UPI003D79502D
MPLEPLTPPDASSGSDLSASDIVEKLMDTVSFAILSITDKKSRVVSSASLAPVLGMVLACMKDNAKKELLLKIPPGSLTEELEMEIHQKLGEFSKDRPYDETGKIISAANFVGTASVTADQFLDRILSECYQTQTLEIDKENVADAADTFVKKKTKGKIKQLFDDLTEYERNQISLVLGNVMEIRGVWREAFPLNSKASSRFLCADGTMKNVRKMRIKEDLHFAGNKVFTAIAKDFRSENGEDLKLVAITPNKTSATAINKLDSETINHLIGKLDESKAEITLDLPVIEVKQGGDTELLEKITDALGTSITARDLSRLNPSPTYNLRMVQKITVSVDEQGADSTIATAAIAASRGDENTFNIDCPSYIAIVGSKGNRLLEMVIKDDSFLVPDGSPVITIPKGRKDVDPWHDDQSDDDLWDDDMSDDEATPSTLTGLSPSKNFQTVGDVSTLIQRGLNPSGELNISGVKLFDDYDLSITVDTVDTANKVIQKVFELIDKKEHKNFVEVRNRSEAIKVKVTFKAWEALCDKLLRDDKK